MSNTRKTSAQQSLLRRHLCLAAAVWTAMVVVLAVYYLTIRQASDREMAEVYARAAHEKDIIYRRWNSLHGGVYVPVSDSIKPNPYLKADEREVTTPSGRVLTLINPAYMTRQVHEMDAQNDGINARITSLSPLNPANAPDDWERKALEDLAQGQSDVSTFEERDGRSYARLIRPLLVEEGCIKCHASEGYKVGDIRGGISVSAPIDSVWKTHAHEANTVLAGYLGLWAIGLAGIGLTGRRMSRSIGERERVLNDLQETTRELDHTNDSLREQFRLGQAASKSKDAFLANMSHEIRTPMTAIMGFSDILLDELTDARQIASAKTIRRNGKHLLKIIDDILDLSKVASGSIDVNRVSLSPSEMINDVVLMMNGRAQDKGISFVVKYASEIPETILSDPTRLCQILTNLLGNAIKFTQVGGVRLVVRLRTKECNNPQLQFDVIDTGIGIPEDKMSLLFEPFSQVDSSNTRDFGGTGLGLAISKQLANKLGGDISASSIIDEGSTFRLTIDTGPLAGVAMVKRPDAKRRVPEERALHHVGANAELDCRILVAEDGLDNQRIISLILRKAGAQVTVAENGKIALDLVLDAERQGNPFGVILMDMQMPVMDGYEATRRLRADGYGGPIVALTACAMAEDERKCLDAGCDDYLTKPLDHATFLPVVAQYAAENPTAAVS